MNKINRETVLLNRVLDGLDSGADPDVIWSARNGNRVLLQYAEDFCLVVTVETMRRPTREGN